MILFLKWAFVSVKEKLSYSKRWNELVWYYIHCISFCYRASYYWKFCSARDEHKKNCANFSLVFSVHIKTENIAQLMPDIACLSRLDACDNKLANCVFDENWYFFYINQQ